MSCYNVSLCRVTNVSVMTNVSQVTHNGEATSPSPSVDSTSPSRQVSGQREAPVTLAQAEVVVTLSLSVLTIACNALVLFLTKFAGGGQSSTMVFVRMLCVSDFFIGCYGLGKMVMFLFVDSLLINFFLPECLFFTASTAACLSLLLLNVDRCVKLASPFWYAQHMDKASVITGMVFLWNVSFVLGFLPLLGWNAAGGPGNVYGFFRFLAWHYLLLLGLLWLGCVGGSAALLWLAQRRFSAALATHAGPGQRLTEAQRYGKLRVTIAVDVGSWALAYLPFLALCALGCPACPLGHVSLDRAVYHLVPVFLLRSLAGAGVQLYRTVRVQGLAKRRLAGPSSSSFSTSTSFSGPSRLHPHLQLHSHHHHLHNRRHRPRRRSRRRGRLRSWEGDVDEDEEEEEDNEEEEEEEDEDVEEEEGVATISYSNPLCGSGISEALVPGGALCPPATALLPLSLPGSPRRLSHVPFYSSSQANGRWGGRGPSSQEDRGISNPAYRASIQLDVDLAVQGIRGVTEEITAL